MKFTNLRIGVRLGVAFDRVTTESVIAGRAGVKNNNR